jgi:IS1 family transposase
VDTPSDSTTTSWLFPPATGEVPFDEKGAFVGRKEKNRDPDDAGRGDGWDHVALDPETRLVVSLVVGRRTGEATEALVRDVHRRTGGRLMRLMTSDEHPAYAEAIRAVYGQVVTPPRTGRPGRPRKAYTVVPPGLTYATVHKTRENGRVGDVSTRVVFGTLLAVVLALVASAVSRAVNTCVVERHHGTDRNRCARKVRKGYTFSKDWAVHRAATAFSYFSYNFGWPVRTLRVKVGGRWEPRTPGMAAGLTDHVWTLTEWLTYPAVQRK